MHQWRTREDAQAFYSGPWLDGIVERYGTHPEISYFDVLAMTDNVRDSVDLLD